VATKKYQIFISSTFSDLQAERQIAFKAILDLEQIPAGMEAFPAIDMEQFEYIKRVIDECDYYLLIIGARYGSTDKTGVSFTELEYDYACEKGKTVIALLHGDIDALPKKNYDPNPALTTKLEAFRDKVKSSRMVKFWTNRDQFIAALMQAIPQAIKIFPAVGWIRGDAAASDAVIQDFLTLRKAYDELETQHNHLLAKAKPKLDNLAPLHDIFKIRYT
jgi:hypothetical protein